jgi:hypothetical protein
MCPAGKVEIPFFNFMEIPAYKCRHELQTALPHLAQNFTPIQVIIAPVFKLTSYKRMKDTIDPQAMLIELD